MNMKPLCIYHGNCADGFTAAWAVWKRFGDEFDYFPGVYQQPPPDVKGRTVVLVDFSYKRDVLHEMAKVADSILILDHHKSAAEDIMAKNVIIGMTSPLEVSNYSYSGRDRWEVHLENVRMDHNENCFGVVHALFDMNRSGAGIAWDFFHPKQKRPALVEFVEDRDLWRFEKDGSRAVNAYVFSHAYTFENWDKLNAETIGDITGVVRAGEAIERKHHKDVAELVAALKQYMTIGGFRVPVANLPYTLTSDAGHLMCTQPMDGVGDADWCAEKPPFAACYWDTPKGRVFSLRSVDGGADVSAIAAQYGGGGHKNASGFTLPHGVSP